MKINSNQIYVGKIQKCKKYRLNGRHMEIEFVDYEHNVPVVAFKDSFVTVDNIMNGKISNLKLIWLKHFPVFKYTNVIMPSYPITENGLSVDKNSLNPCFEKSFKITRKELGKITEANKSLIKRKR